MKKKYILFPCLIFLFFVQIGQAQERFKVAAVAGFNLSQIEGDNFSGYQKLGVGGGLRASVLLTDQFRLDFEMLYSQRGATSGAFKGFTTTPHFFRVDLDYTEIPITATYKWKEVKTKKKAGKRKSTYYRYAAHVGGTVGRLINLKIEEKLNTSFVSQEIAEKLINFSEIEESIIKNDVGGFFGVSYYFTKHIGMTVRHSTSLTPLYNPRDNGAIGGPLINYYITTVGFYEF